MKPSLIPVSLFGLATLASANPIEKRAFNVGLTFHGVDGSTYGETFPADASQVPISQSPLYSPPSPFPPLITRSPC